MTTCDADSPVLATNLCSLRTDIYVARTLAVLAVLAVRAVLAVLDVDSISLCLQVPAKLITFHIFCQRLMQIVASDDVVIVVIDVDR